LRIYEYRKNVRQIERSGMKVGQGKMMNYFLRQVTNHAGEMNTKYRTFFLNLKKDLRPNGIN